LTPLFNRKRALAALTLGFVLISPCRAQESAPQAPPANEQSVGKPATKPFDVKNTFRNICGFCHEDYGRKAGKGPQLMNSQKTDQELFNRIKNGLAGRMAAFGSSYSDEQIQQIVLFIRNLKPDQTP
jgi:mono/diheme cytochrome c family protein